MDQGGFGSSCRFGLYRTRMGTVMCRPYSEAKAEDLKKALVYRHKMEEKLNSGKRRLVDPYVKIGITAKWDDDEDDYTGGVTIPDSGSKTWGKPEGRFGQGHVNWSGLSNLFKDSDDDALGVGGLRMCCQAMIDSCLRCHARNRMIMQQLRDSRMKDDDDQLGFDDFGRPSHTRPHMPDSKSVGDWLN